MRLTFIKSLRYVLLGLFSAATYATLLLGFDLAVRITSPLQPYLKMLEPDRLLIVFALTFVLVVSASALHRLLERGSKQRLAALLVGPTERSWLTACLLIGTAVRISWYLAFPAPQTNDGAAYLELAAKLAHGETYFIPGQMGGFAFWPPGLPFLLLPSLKLLGSPLWLPLLNNLVLMAVSIVACSSLGLRLLNKPAARLSALLLAFWPSYAFSAGLAQKELVLVALLPLALLCYLKARDESSLHARTLFAFGGGILLGFSVLTQPSSGLIPFVWAAVDYFFAGRWRAVALRFLPLALGAILVVAPWSMRNAQVFDAFVPVSTNSGFVFYVGNNAQALGNAADTGGTVTPEGLLDWHTHNDHERSRAYMATAKQWVAEHPVQFIGLIVKRFVLIMGDDSDGIYRTIKLGLEQNSMTYALLKAGANFSWLVLMLLILPRFLPRADGDRFMFGTAILGLTLLYFIFLHSLAEGGSRHHLGTIWCYLLFAAAALTAARPGPHEPEESIADES